MWEEWKNTILVCFILFGTIGVTIGYVAWDTVQNEDATCLAYVIDTKLDQFAISKRRDHPEIAEKQIEAIARVHLSELGRTSQSICPKSWTRWVAWSRWRYYFGAKENSERWRLIYPIARAAVRGSYKHEWPEEWECVDDIKPTNGSPRNWYKATRYWLSGTKVAGKIENMTLYCTGVP